MPVGMGSGQMQLTVMPSAPNSTASERVRPTTRASGSSFRSTHATFAPSSANSFAVASPMPLAAPVTIATLPSMERLRRVSAMLISLCP